MARLEAAGRILLLTTSNISPSNQGILDWLSLILAHVSFFLLGIDVGGNESIIKGLHTLGLEAIIITVAAVAGSTLCAWGLWYLLYKWNGGKETKA